ncbi:MAG TPA: glycerophosphodiester phosphodiesterase family protein [Flavitalea sp.]|nr:glycerophosphodiester phosphodiesterase family protein [Flavitalea sp.]
MKGIFVKSLVCFCLFLSCSEMKSTSINTPVFDKQGHRGCRGLMPENTVAAMIRAVDLGVTTLEMDVVITSDDTVLLSHEPFFNHEITTRQDGTAISESEEKRLNIYRMTFLETQAFDVGMRPHPRFPLQKKVASKKPTLSEVIDSVELYITRNKKAPPFYNIETKSNPGTDALYHPEPRRFVQLLMNVINSKNIASRVIIQSFDIRTLQEMHANYPAVKTALLVEDFDKRPFDDQLRRLGFVPSIYSPHVDLVTAELVQQCHAKKIRLIPWTVNDKATIQRLRQLGVDGIISDFPDLFD